MKFTQFSAGALKWCAALTDGAITRRARANPANKHVTYRLSNLLLFFKEKREEKKEEEKVEKLSITVRGAVSDRGGLRTV